MQRQDAEKLLPGGFIREDEEEEVDEDEEDVEEDTELEEEEGEGLPAPREASVERSHRYPWIVSKRKAVKLSLEGTTGLRWKRRAR